MNSLDTVDTACLLNGMVQGRKIVDFVSFACAGRESFTVMYTAHVVHGDYSRAD